MVKRSYRGLFIISGEWLGIYMELFSNFSGLIAKWWTAA
jgi:hypothetical protein